MTDAIRNNATPNFLFLHYDLATWSIQNLLLIPHFAFPPSAIVERPPLSATARRAGWVGCNIALDRIPLDARIHVVKDRGVAPAETVREQFRKVKPLAALPVNVRGWALDVLNIVRRLGKAQFANADVYAFEGELAALHPGNRHIRDKIRQQLQVLRDVGLLVHAGRNAWALPSDR